MTTDETACLVAVTRTVPDGLPRRAPTASTPEAMSSSAGRSDRSNVSPASVVDTERVVHDRSRTPSRSSKAFMAWLNADCDMPSSAAARVKLPCSATAAKAARSYRSSRYIHDRMHKPK
jgi:hypothetical protein